MHRLSTLLLVFLVAGIFAAKDKDDQPLTITGKVQFPGGSRLPIEKDAQLTVKLQDVSLMDAPSKLIAQTTAKLVRFPASFTIKYSSKQIEPFNSYSLSAVVENKKKELLYINDVSVRVQPIGADRTKTKDIPVKQIKSTVYYEKYEFDFVIVFFVQNLKSLNFNLQYYQRSNGLN